MEDEACVTADVIIEQMSEGNDWVFREFGVRPTIGWQIDPFGHASAQATLFAKMGFNAFFFGRLDYQDYSNRTAHKNLEFIWRGTQSLKNHNLDIFTHVLYEMTYCIPQQFDFQSINTQPVMNDKRLENYNIDAIANEFKKNINDRLGLYRTNQIMFTYGCDFEYQNADINFKNMDKLMKYINARPDIYNLNVFYSTPSQYVAAVNRVSQEQKMKWSLNEYDFFPYASGPYQVWSGFFTSRPTLKGYSASRLALLQSIETFLSITRGRVSADKQDYFNGITDLAQRWSVLSHHDAITGTERQHVADDYAKQLYVGTDSAHKVYSNIASLMLTSKSSKSDSALNFGFCEKMNVSECPITQGLSKSNPVPVILYNPLGWTRYANIRVPIPVSTVQVIGPQGMIVSQVTKNFGLLASELPYSISFSLPIGPLSYTSVVLQILGGDSKSNIAHYPLVKAGADVSMANKYVTATFSGQTNRLSKLQNLVTGQSITIDHQLLYWNSSAGNNANSSTPSGNYVFRPNGTSPFNFTANGIPNLSMLTQGPVFSELLQVWSDWASTVWRLWSNSNTLELENTIGPIPINDNCGKEAISRFSVQNLNTNSVFYTDSEGMEFQKRIRNYRATYDLNVTDPVSLNYFPIDACMYIQDDKTNTRFNVLVDRSEGGGSLNDGQCEVMLHRRLLYPDFNGEALNDSTIVRSVENVYLDRINSSSRVQRRANLEINTPVTVIFNTNWQGKSSDSWFKTFETGYNAMIKDLPKNVHIMTMRTIETGETIVRLWNIYAVGEDEEYSKRVTVDLGALWKDLNIVQIKEMSLLANARIEDINRLVWNVTNVEEDPSKEAKLAKYKPVDMANLNVEIDPMDIRTFLVRFI